jgi:transcriptional regulator with XRE-family HTH domain
MQEQHSFGYWLRLKRKALDLTREALADRVGCSVSTIRKLEEEERRPSTQIAELLAEIFKIPTTERTAFLRFARGDWRSAPSLGDEEAPWHVSTPALPQQPRSNLPATFTSLIGRDKDIAAVQDYLTNPDIRLVTLIGAPGIGKTRLSIASASSHWLISPMACSLSPWLRWISHP